MRAVTQELSHFISSTKYDALPTEVRSYSKTLALSALGAMIAGGDSTASEIVTRYARRGSGAAEATVLDSGFAASLEFAAFANASYAHATEYEDDSFPEAVSSYTLFPAVFALCENLHSDGQTLIEAFILGYETQARIGLACSEARRLGYMVLSLAGTLGCAAAASKVLKLDKKRTAWALSIAASQASGLGSQTGSMAHIVEMGFAARNGITAALLAADGLTGQCDILESPRGLLNIITAGKVKSLDAIIDSWGKPFRVMEVGIKEFPCCYHLQRIISSAQDLRKTGEISADRVEAIDVDVNSFFPTVVQHPEPVNDVEAQFSLPHAIAAALLEPRVLPESFSRAKINAPEFKAMRRRVRMHIREDWGWAPTGWIPRIVYKLSDGRQIVDTPDVARGQPPGLLSFDECIPKYRGCTERRLPKQVIDTSIEIVRKLECCEDVANLLKLLAC